MDSVAVEEIIEQFSLERLNDVELSTEVEVKDIKRPGLELAGFFEHFTPDRIQVLGKTELSFLAQLEEEILSQRLARLLDNNIPCVVITRSQELPDEMIRLAKKNSVPLLRTDYSTTSFISRLTDFLDGKFAPEVTRHGVLVEVYGVGIFIRGSSGIGKSESALDLIKRGHRLVADDAVIIKKVMRDTLVGTSPEISRHYMEVRGIGIIDVSTLFGAGAIRKEQSIDFILNLEAWDENKNYDRLGLKDDEEEILNVVLPSVTIPVRPGRNLAMVMEVAAMNFRLKNMGYNAAEAFTNKLEDALQK